MAALIWSPFDTKDDARAAARILLDEGLIACANLIASVESLFVWQGEVQTNAECGALFKTDAALLATAVARLETVHPYDTPVIMAWNADEAGKATEAWLGMLTRE